MSVDFHFEFTLITKPKTLTVLLSITIIEHKQSFKVLVVVPILFVSTFPKSQIQITAASSVAQVSINLVDK